MAIWNSTRIAILREPGSSIFGGFSYRFMLWDANTLADDWLESLESGGVKEDISLGLVDRAILIHELWNISGLEMDSVDFERLLATGARLTKNEFPGEYGTMTHLLFCDLEGNELTLNAGFFYDTRTPPLLASGLIAEDKEDGDFAPVVVDFENFRTVYQAALDAFSNPAVGYPVVIIP